MDTYQLRVIECIRMPDGCFFFKKKQTMKKKGKNSPKLLSPIFQGC